MQVEQMLICLSRKSHVVQINSLLKRAFIFGYRYLKSIITVEQLLKNYDGTLLNIVIASNHTMHHLLPTPKFTCYSLISVVMVSQLPSLDLRYQKKTIYQLHGI